MRAAASAAAPAGSSDLKIAKADGPDPVGVGSTLTYTLEVESLGPDAATGVVVKDSLPKGVDFVSATASQGSCARKGRTVTCELGTLAAPTVDYGGPPTVTIAVIPRKVGTLSNSASVDGVEKDPGQGQQPGDGDDDRRRTAGDMPRPAGDAARHRRR